MVRRDFRMAVPGLDVAVVELDIAHTTLHQPSGDEQLSRLYSLAVGIADVLWLLTDIKGIGRCELHSKGKFERSDPCIEA